MIWWKNRKTLLAHCKAQAAEIVRLRDAAVLQSDFQERASEEVRVLSGRLAQRDLRNSRTVQELQDLRRKNQQNFEDAEGYKSDLHGMITELGTRTTERDDARKLATALGVQVRKLKRATDWP